MTQHGTSIAGLERKYFSNSMTSEIEGGASRLVKLLQTALTKKEGCLVGRFGTIECNVLHWLTWRANVECPEEIRAVLERNAGIFPGDVESVRVWGEATKAAFQAADCLAVGWYAPTKDMELQLLGTWGWDAERVALRSLEPYYVAPANRWTRLLAGRRVCAVSSFAETAAEQAAKGEEAIWGDMEMFGGDVAWSFVRTGYAPCLAQGRAGWEESPCCWQEAVEWTVREVLLKDPEVVIIGCGGLGMVIGARLKKAGKICLVLGGATQVLFGIKGERWRQHTVIGKLWNSEWVWPSEEETPHGAEEVEGGCYWLKKA
jgi:hypothetical protein